MKVKTILFSVVFLGGLFFLLANDEGDEGFVFHTPAYQGPKDISDGKLLTQFKDQWDGYMNRFTSYSSTYNIGLEYSAPGYWYVNPKEVNVPMDNPDLQVPIRWEAFPGRTQHFYENRFDTMFPKKIASSRFYELADIGPSAFGEKYGNKYVFLPPNPDCHPKDSVVLSPFGPRGWLDEYCEMGVLRNEQQEITRLHFTCENPEYYWNLWHVDPASVLKIYKDVLGTDDRQINIEDLYLTDRNNQPVIDRTTGRPAYNPINKWNSGTKMANDRGGAMHLTSAPNEVSAEIVLAGGAAVLRDKSVAHENVANSLIQCSNYGSIYRHSDPHIGQNAYEVVEALNLRITLLDPVGLYLQEPIYDYFTLPASAPKGAKAQDLFKFVRGEAHHKNYPNNMILHMVMEIPDSWGSSLTLEDVMVLGSPIKYGSQVMQSIKVQLAATGIEPETGRKPERKPCTNPDAGLPAAEYLVDNNILDGSLHNGLIDSSNVTPLILELEAGAATGDIALVIGGVEERTDRSKLAFSIPGSSIQLDAVYKGNLSTPLHCFVGFRYDVTFSVPADAEEREYPILVQFDGKGEPMPSMIKVVAAGSLGK